MKPWPRLAAMWCACCAGCQSPHKAEPDLRAIAAREQATTDVRAELDAYYRDLSARRWNAFASHFWPGATITTIGQPKGEPRERIFVQSVSEFIDRAPEGPDSKPIFSEKVLHLDVRVEGTMAQAWARYQAEFGDPGRVQHWTGSDAFTLLRNEGRWRIVSLVFTPD